MLKISALLFAFVLLLLAVEESSACFGSTISPEPIKEQPEEPEPAPKSAEQDTSDKSQNVVCLNEQIKEILTPFTAKGGDLEQLAIAAQKELKSKLNSKAEVVCSRKDTIGWTIHAKDGMACKVVGKKATCLGWLD